MSDPQNILPQGESISGNLAICAFVEKSHLFKKVEQADLGMVYGAGLVHRLKSGQRVIQEGEVGDRLFLILSGTVQVVAQSPRGPVELARLSRGAIFGEVGFLTGKPRTANVLALDAVEVISFARPDLDPVLNKYPKLRKVLQVMMSARAEKAIEMTTSQ
jgi:CRP-like cAMP-binding protein